MIGFASIFKNDGSNYMYSTPLFCGILLTVEADMDYKSILRVE